MFKTLIHQVAISFAVAIAIIPWMAHARDTSHRLGIGMSDPFVNDVKALSFKVQSNPSYAFGGLLGVRMEKDSKAHALGLKFYRNIFEEPQLTFYSSWMAAMIGEEQSGKSTSGFQTDFTLGTEFSFTGLESLGFSCEFGISLYKLENDLSFATVGNHFIVAGFHFYL